VLAILGVGRHERTGLRHRFDKMNSDLGGIGSAPRAPEPRSDAQRLTVDSALSYLAAPTLTVERRAATFRCHNTTPPGAFTRTADTDDWLVIEQ
jgi:hypothetical protein